MIFSRQTVSFSVAQTSPHLFSVLTSTRPALSPKMDPDLRWSTSPYCAGVVDLVIFGNVSARDGVLLLSVFRKTGSLEQRKCAVAALRFLAHCPDVGIARSSRFALHDLFVEDMWFLFTRNRDAVARVRSEYEEVTPGIQYQASAAGPAAAPSTSVPAVIPLVKKDDGDADSLESF